MAGEFLIEGPEDFSKEIEFDKFMDEILINESSKKEAKETDGKGEHARRIMEKITERAVNRIRWSK